MSVSAQPATNPVLDHAVCDDDANRTNAIRHGVTENVLFDGQNRLGHRQSSTVGAVYACTANVELATRTLNGQLTQSPTTLSWLCRGSFPHAANLT